MVLQSTSTTNDGLVMITSRMIRPAWNAIVRLLPPLGRPVILPSTSVLPPKSRTRGHEPALRGDD